VGLKHNGERFIYLLIAVNIAAGSVEELDRLARDVMDVVDGGDRDPIFVFGSCDSFTSSALMVIHRLPHVDMELHISEFLILNAS
jgi:hypothetical protein